MAKRPSLEDKDLETYALSMGDDDKQREGDIWLNRISNSRSYESIYRRQAYSAYKLYNKNYEDVYIYDDPNATFASVDKKVEHYSAKNNRSNIYYSNIEALISLVLPELPNVKVYLNNFKNYTPKNDAEQSSFYDVALGVLEECARYFITNSLKKGTFKKFKMDYFITGRGVLWVDSFTEVPKGSSDQKEISTISLDYVHWLNYTQDPKLAWEDVRWVARRMYLNKSKLKRLYPNVDFEDFSFTSNPYTTLQGDDNYAEIDTTYLASGGKYVEIWEIWDKFTQSRIVVSQQSDNRIISVQPVKNVPEEYFFPTAQAPIGIMNGLDNRPSSEVWNYLHELKQLNFIALRKEQLLKSLQLRGFCSATNSEMLMRLNNTRDGDIIAVQNYDPENPDVIHYLDNKPKVEMLQLLSQEHEALKQNIYEITGISDQMRNISAQEDSQPDVQTATEVKTKTIFGSRRLREKQDVVVQYIRDIYKIVVFRCCHAVNTDTMKRITNLQILDSNGEQIATLMQQQQQIQMAMQQQQMEQQQQGMMQQGGGQPQGQPQQDPNAQAQQAQQQAQAAQQQAQQAQQQAQQAQQVQQQPQQQGGQQQPGQQPQTQAQGGSKQMFQTMQQEAQQGKLSPSAQPGVPGQPNPQQQMNLVEQQLQELRDTPTWEALVAFFNSEAMQIINIDVDLDDLNNLMGKAQLTQQNLMQTANLMQTMGNVVQMAQQMPEFVEVWASLLESTMDSSLYSLSQKKQIRDFSLALKKKIAAMLQQPPQPPPPDPAAIQAQAYMVGQQAKAQLDQAKAQQTMIEAQIEQAKLQMEQSQMGQNPVIDPNEQMKLNAKIQEANIRHQQELEKLQMQIQAQDARAKDKMMSDENLMKMKIEADEHRYQEKMQADVQKEQVKASQMQPIDNYE